MTTTINETTMTIIQIEGLNLEKKNYLKPDINEKIPVSELRNEALKKLMIIQEADDLALTFQISSLLETLQNTAVASQLSENEIFQLYKVAKKITKDAADQVAASSPDQVTPTRNPNRLRIQNLCLLLLLAIYLIGCALDTNQFEPTADTSISTLTAEITPTPEPPNPTASISPQDTSTVPHIASATPDGGVSEIATQESAEEYRQKLLDYFNNDQEIVDWLLAANVIPNASENHTNQPPFGSYEGLQILRPVAGNVYGYLLLTQDANYTGVEGYKPGDIAAFDNASDLVKDYEIFNRPDALSIDAIFYMRDASGNLTSNLANVRNGGTVFWREGDTVIPYEYHPDSGIFEQLEAISILEHNLNDLHRTSENILNVKSNEVLIPQDGISITAEEGITYNYGFSALPIISGGNRYDTQLVINPDNWGLYLDPRTEQFVEIPMPDPITGELRSIDPTIDIFQPYTDLIREIDTLFAVDTSNPDAGVQHFQYSDIESAAQVDGQTTVEFRQIFITASSINELLNTTSGLSPNIALETLDTSFAEFQTGETHKDGVDFIYNFVSITPGKAIITQIIRVPPGTFSTSHQIDHLILRRWGDSMNALMLTEQEREIISNILTLDTPDELTAILRKCTLANDPSVEQTYADADNLDGLSAYQKTNDPFQFFTSQTD